MAKVEFRDGVREIPDYLADLMTEFETYQLTADEAIAQVNKNLERKVLTNAYDSVVKDHFSPFGHGRGT